MSDRITTSERVEVPRTILQHPSGAGLYVPLEYMDLSFWYVNIPEQVRVHPLTKSHTGVLLSPNVVVKHRTIETGIVATFVKVVNNDATAASLYAKLHHSGWHGGQFR